MNTEIRRKVSDVGRGEAGEGGAMGPRAGAAGTRAGEGDAIGPRAGATDTRTGEGGAIGAQGRCCRYQGR